MFGDSNEQFCTHEKLSPTSTIYVNCMKHDPIDLIYNFTLSKALLIHTYNFRLILAGNLSIYRQDCDSAYSAPIQHDADKNQTL